MKYISLFETFSNQTKQILLIVDVQKSFSEFFTDNYCKELKNFCKNFDEVYQIFDNHHQGTNIDKDYLYDDSPKADDTSDLYNFPNQSDVIEKRYNYDVDVNFYKKVLDEETFELIKSKEKKLKKGEFFKTTEGTIIVYIGNNHKWFHVPKKLYDLFNKLKEAQKENLKIVIVGGAKGECLEDIITAANSLGLEIIKNDNFIYSATNCPIK
jgi:hypothetical protein